MTPEERARQFFRCHGLKPESSQRAALTVLIRAAVEAETEACAKVCDERSIEAEHNEDYMVADEAEQCAAAIRARKEQG